MADLQSLGLRPEKGVNPQIQEAVAKDRMSLERPIPGESLTNNPDNPYPFEQAPEYTDRTDALEYLFATFVKEKTYLGLLRLISDDVPLINIAEIFLYKGFTEGKWNPDLMLMLAEPTVYILMALAERANIEYKVISDEDDEDLTEEEIYGKPEKDDDNFRMFGKKYSPENLTKMEKKSRVSKGSLPSEISKKIEEMPVPVGLMARPEQDIT
jgi:hypothetical protein